MPRHLDKLLASILGIIGSVAGVLVNVIAWHVYVTEVLEVGAWTSFAYLVAAAIAAGIALLNVATTAMIISFVYMVREP